MTITAYARLPTRMRPHAHETARESLCLGCAVHVGVRGRDVGGGAEQDARLAKDLEKVHTAPYLPTARRAAQA